jgi:MFS family permease
VSAESRVTGWVRNRWRQYRWLRLLVTFAAYIAAITLLAVAAEAHEWTQRVRVPRLALVLPGVAGLLVVAFVLHRSLRDRQREAPVPLAVIAAAISVVGAALAGAWFAGGHVGLFGFAGVVALYFGVGLLLGSLRAWDGRPQWMGVAVLGGVIVVFGIGLVILTLEGASWAMLALVAAVLAAPVALTLLTDDALDRMGRARWRVGRRTRRQARRLWVAVGAAVLLAGMLGLSIRGAQPTYLAIAVVAIVVLVGAIASDTSADIVLVLIAVALVWSLAPRNDPAPDAVKPNKGDTVLAALGDSFMSGEGAERFIGRTNIRKQNECRRAPTAYPVKVVERKSDAIPDKVLFLACSGAVAKHLATEWQFADEASDIDKPVKIGSGKAAREIKGQLARLVHDVKAEHLKVDRVILSIGGNDASFGEIGKACVGPGDCSTFGGFWLENLDKLYVGNGKGILEKAYADVKAVLATINVDPANVVVIPYPVPLNDRGCGWSLLRPNEHRFLNAFTGELDAVVARAARAAGFQFLGEMERVLGEHELRICDRSPGKVGVNFLAANPVAGVLQQQVSPQNWFHNSLHPNKTGHAAMADVLAGYLDPALKPESPDEPPADTTRPDRVRTIREIMGRNFRNCAPLGGGLPSCRSSTSDWTRAQIAESIWYDTIPLVLVAAGGWLLWLQLLATRRFREWW